MSAPVVIVTRPAAQAGKLIQRLQGLGYVAWALPTIEIHALTEATVPTEHAALQAALAQLPSYDLVIPVSPNAIACALAPYLQHAVWPAQTALAVLGPGSVAALAELGLQASSVTIHHPTVAANEADVRYDSEQLWQVLQHAYGQDWSGKRVLLLRGQEGREWLPDTLRAAGAQVDAVPCYARTCPTLTTGQQAQLQGYADQPEGAAIWLLTSSEGVRHLATMLSSQPALWAWAIRQTALIPHPRIAEQARALGFIDIRLSAPGDEGLLNTLTHPPV